MSSFFKDSIFENLDDISQMVEPFQCQLNDELNKLPDRINIDFQTALYHFSNKTRYGSFGNLDVRQVLQHHMKDASVNWAVLNNDKLQSFFSFMVGNGEKNQECYLDIDNKQLTNSLALIKHKAGYDDDELYKLLIDALKDEWYYAMKQPGDISKANINEIADVFDIDGVQQERALKPKRDILIKALIEQFNDRKINIRNYELGIRFGKWITAYVCQNHMGAIKNLTLFKVMMLNGRPIYSIDNEEKL